MFVDVGVVSVVVNYFLVAVVDAVVFIVLDTLDILGRISLVVVLNFILNTSFAMALVVILAVASCFACGCYHRSYLQSV